MNRKLIVILAVAITAFIIGWLVLFSRASLFADNYENLTQHESWLNTSRKLNKDDLKGRIILLDFWTYCCINCMHVLPDLTYLEKTFGSQITIIGVHSAKFKNEQDTTNIRNAILRYGIEHPVINDFDFSSWDAFNIKSWPTFVLLNPQGSVESVYKGEGHRVKIETDIRRLLATNPATITTSLLPVKLEKDKVRPTVLSFPGKIYPSPQGLFVADSGHHRILTISPKGTILTTIGSGSEGFQDGAFSEAKFRRPHGILFDKDKLYIADTGNHALRVANFKTRHVKTLAGTGEIGNVRAGKQIPARIMLLSSPWDLTFFLDNNHIMIAMAGTHQIWSYDILKQNFTLIAGDGKEDLDDGSLPYNSLAQTSGLSAIGNKLWFVDSESSSLRFLKEAEVQTAIGKGLFHFGYKDGKRTDALMQHPLGVLATPHYIYVADSFNHAIVRYNPANETLQSFSGSSTAGNLDGNIHNARFNEPGDIKQIGNKLYIADTNNHAIRTIDLRSLRVATLPISPAELPPQQELFPYSDILPNLQTIPNPILPPNKKIDVRISLKPDWKINEQAPNFVALYNHKKLVEGFEYKDIHKLKLTLHSLKPNQEYQLQATFYYCEKKPTSQCMIKSFNTSLHITEGAKSNLTFPLNE